MTKINLLKRASQSGSKVSLSADLVRSPGASGENQGPKPSPNRAEGAGSAAQPVAAKTNDGADQTLSANAQKKPMTAVSGLSFVAGAFREAGVHPLPPDQRAALFVDGDQVQTVCYERPELMCLACRRRGDDERRMRGPMGSS